MYAHIGRPSNLEENGIKMNLLARRFGCLGPMAIAAFATVVTAAEPLGTGFTYQGQLKSQGIPLEGDVDLGFTLWDSATGGATVAVADAHPGVDVVNGLFTVQLDFG